MNPVRPNVWGHVPPPAQQGPGAAKAAAQRAFFDAALGKATGTPQAQPQTPPAPVRATPVQAQATPPTAQSAEHPARILRPGSLLDIRV